jgi:hypothetical protein
LRSGSTRGKGIAGLAGFDYPIVAHRLAVVISVGIAAGRAASVVVYACCGACQGGVRRLNRRIWKAAVERWGIGNGCVQARRYVVATARAIYTHGQIWALGNIVHPNRTIKSYCRCIRAVQQANGRPLVEIPCCTVGRTIQRRGHIRRYRAIDRRRRLRVITVGGPFA